MNNLEALRGCHFRLWEYAPSHSTLTLRAVRPDAGRHNIYITFVDVMYLQAPIGWDADLVACEESEKLQLLRELVSSPASVSEHVAVYKAETLPRTVYIVARLDAIASDVEPMFGQ